MEGKAITAKEVDDKLKGSNFKINQAENIRKLLEQFEALQFAPNTTGNNDELLNESQSLIENLEKQY
tara:strand:+ start:85 stop:285 length:201 start_codon:yes stop_codon:yes gene_type:complete